MAHDAVLESLICGIGYEMTPSEEKLWNQRRHQEKQQERRQESISGTMKPFQARTHGDTLPDEGRLRGSSKLRRAFSLNSYRNPFRAKSQHGKSLDLEEEKGGDDGQPIPPPADPSVNSANTTTPGGHDAKRRVSWRKFLLKIATQFGGSNLIVKQKAAAAAAASSVAAGQQQNDRVPPLNGHHWPADQTPGVTGLRNHGNTCFMNAVLQCLSHTDILAEYFVMDLYKADLKRRNKINSKKFGTKGELTEQLALVLKALWTCRDTPEFSSSFKAVVDRYSSQFRSSTQHDAQEFLFWLLDKVHEDLNTATKKRYKSMKNNYGRPDEVIAAETLANHIRCNNSFVQAVFQAQFRSSLTCPRCHKQSNTFDPFHCISVQLPQLVQRPVFVTVVYTSQHPKQVKLGLTVDPGASVIALKEQLHLDTGIAMDRILLVEITETGFSRVFCDSHPLSSIKDTDPIYCVETPKVPETTTTSGVSGSTAKDKQAKIVLCILNVKRKAAKKEDVEEKNGDDKSDSVKEERDEKSKKASDKPVDKVTTGEDLERFGTPLCLQVNRDISYAELQRLLLKEMASVLKSEVFTFETPVKELYKIRLQDPSADPDTYLQPTVAHPLFTEMIDLALSVVPSDGGPAHVKLLLEWAQPEKFFSDMADPTLEHASVAQLKEKNKEGRIPSLSLEQCLDHYTKAETLSTEDAWRCPHCQKYLPVVKTLGMWSLPDILVIHFKRFRQHQMKGPQSAKLTTMVKFPMHGFDMSPHLAKTEGGSASSSAGSSIGSLDSKYDLYAVCYHQGNTLETGHYTAACLNPYDQQWYRYDDQRVSQVPKERVEEEIINDEAYMLFYQKRKVDSDGSECSGSSTGSSGDHWISRIAPNVLPKVESKEKRVVPLAVAEEMKECVIEEVEVVVKENVPEVVEMKVVEVEQGKCPQEEDDKEKNDGNEGENATETRETNEETVPIAIIEDKTTAIKPDEDEVDTTKNNDKPIIDVDSTDLKIVEEVEQRKEDEMVKEIGPIDEVVVVRKSSPIPIQRSSAPLDWSKAFDDSLTNMNNNNSSHSIVTRHSSQSYTNAAKGRDLESAVTLLRASSSCSKDSFMFMDHHRHVVRPHHHRSSGRSLLDEDDVLGATNHSLWISPVSSHKMITVSPKN